MALVALSSCAVSPRPAPVRPVPVQQSDVFGGDYISIHPPPSPGWVKIQESQSGIAFAKRDETHAGSFIANVAVFGLESTETPEQLEALIREAARKDAEIDPIRFEVEHETVTYTDERSYPCVRYRSITKDNDPAGPEKPLILELDAIYCRHPVQPESGFGVIYSYRGTKRHSGLRTEAESFIQGVQIPEKQ